jgi:hypothetical protein
MRIRKSFSVLIISRCDDDDDDDVDMDGQRGKILVIKKKNPLKSPLLQQRVAVLELGPLLTKSDLMMRAAADRDKNLSRFHREFACGLDVT